MKDERREPGRGSRFTMGLVVVQQYPGRLSGRGNLPGEPSILKLASSWDQTGTSGRHA